MKKIKMNYPRKNNSKNYSYGWKCTEKWRNKGHIFLKEVTKNKDEIMTEGKTLARRTCDALACRFSCDRKTC